MNKGEFLDKLREALNGEVGDSEIHNNINYYNSYIIDEVGKGRTEQAVLEELGDPRLIARTIIDTSAFSGAAQDGTVHSDENYSRRNEQQNNSQDYNYRRFVVNSGGMKWYTKILILILVFTVIIGILSLIGSLLSLVLPFLLPLLLIFIIVSMFGGNRR